MVIFLDSFKGKSEKDGKVNEYQRLTLMEVNVKKDGTYYARTESFFVDNVDCSKLKCGDLVKVEFEQFGVISPKLKLVGLTYGGANVFEKYI